ncbi:hypothetical protein G1C95_1445 [Bifidobacterium sp. DSM 109957]|uniref:Uncharacterized protein n=1 Tax=Bifidobacterium oedipodis TaxID=2675322 RepID=A0A7Y0EQR8_9BIFI|nr:hypothetical protein [Bifidobacterium sp. DSM 109957]
MSPFSEQQHGEYGSGKTGNRNGNSDGYGGLPAITHGNPFSLHARHVLIKHLVYDDVKMYAN